MNCKQGLDMECPFWYPICLDCPHIFSSPKVRTLVKDIIKEGKND